MMVEDFLSADVRLTLALDFAEPSQQRWREQLGEVLNAVTCLSAWPEASSGHRSVSAVTVADALTRSGAAEVVMGALDEIGSACLRRAAFGWWPPAVLRTRWSGIYHRPRFLTPGASPNHWLKRIGFARLTRAGWFRRVFLLDEFLCASERAHWPEAPFHFLPTPCVNIFQTPQEEARRMLDVPPKARVFLFYGGGYRRKGLHLVLEAFQNLPPASASFLLCAGQQPPDAEVQRGLQQLSARGQARVLDRFVSTAEEELCICACDAVLLPYLGHFGTSGVLAQAVHAGKAIIVSDEELLGRRVRAHNLGWLFPSGDGWALRGCIEKATRATASALAAFSAAAKTYAGQCTRMAFREALLSAFSFKQNSPPADKAG